jgi:hypothetical protein
MVNFSLRPLYHLWKNPDTHWKGSWVGPQSRFGRSSEDKILFLLPEIEPRIVQPVAWSLY